MASESCVYLLLNDWKPELLAVHHGNMEAQYALPWRRGRTRSHLLLFRPFIGAMIFDSNEFQRPSDSSTQPQFPLPLISSFISPGCVP
jgi:hypothetical protein